MATKALRACIHRGTRQIGGSCIELECAGARLLLDLGLPLDAAETDPLSLIPPVSGLLQHDTALVGIVLSHGHGDHWGLTPHVLSSVPLISGAATRRIMVAASAFVPGDFPAAIAEAPISTLEDRRTIHVGPFSITPFLVDHSAYDAYALLVEGEGRRLFYTSDIRAHGRKARLFERLLANPPRPIHAMLMEGSSLGRLDPDQRFPSETEVEDVLVARLRDDGFVAVCASAQNIDRVVSIYRACKRSGRTLLLDLYAMEMLRATGNENLPGPGWSNLAVYVPEYQRRHVARTERFDIVDRYRGLRVYREQLAARMVRSAMLFRPATVPDIDLIPDAWLGARMICSQWDGYLRDPATSRFTERLAERGVPWEVVHTSGHAAVPDLKRLVEALAPDALIPVHTFHGERFAALYGEAVRRRGMVNDGRCELSGSEERRLAMMDEAETLLADMEGPEALEEMWNMQVPESGSIVDRAVPEGWLDRLLAAEAAQGWFGDVLADPDLMIAFRGRAMDVYHRGQAVFRANLGSSPASVETHEKYLVDPDLAGHVKLRAGKFDVEEVIGRGFTSEYEGPKTLAKMKRAAAYYAGDEKAGCHEILKCNPCVIDCEVAFPDFTATDGAVVKKGRIDLVTIVPDGPQARLMFWEAKLFGNPDLRADPKREDSVPKVAHQIRRYQTWVAAHHELLERSYRNVARNIGQLSAAGWVRRPTETILKVADGQLPLVCGPDPENSVGLLIYDFDQDQRDGGKWKPHMERLQRSGVPVIARGRAGDIRLG